MVKKSHCYATVVIFLTISLQACADNLQCKRVQSVYGTMLKGHVFQESNAASILTCGQLCNSNIRCQSINYNAFQTILWFFKIGLDDVFMPILTE